MSRDLDSIRFELDYLGELLNDSRAVVDGIGDAANVLLGAMAPTLALAGRTLDGAGRADLLAVTEAATGTMTALAAVMQRATALGELLGGRVEALGHELKRELGGEPS